MRDDITPSLRRVKDELARWHASFPAEVVRDQIEELKRQRAELDAVLAELEEDFGRWESMKNGTAPWRGRTHIFPAAVRGRPPGSKREAVRDLLIKHGPMANAEIRDRLIEAGLVESTPKGRKNLDATLYHMNKSGEIGRVHGLYRLRPDAGGESASDGVQNRRPTQAEEGA